MGKTIRITSGWSNPGGSTEAFILLTNQLNARGHDCVFYGPHEWHLDKCKSGKLLDFNAYEYTEHLIYHFLVLQERPKCKSVILNCHETNLFPLKDRRDFIYDKVVFVSEYQKAWQGVKGEVIPNLLTNLEKFPIHVGKPAGIIGSIDAHKQPHLAIQRAFVDGYREINMYGLITDEPYFIKHILPYLNSGNVFYKGYSNNKQEMYESISCVYSASPRETFNLVLAECRKIDMEYFGFDTFEGIPPDYSLTNEQILDKWEEVFDAF